MFKDGLLKVEIKNGIKIKRIEKDVSSKDNIYFAKKVYASFKFEKQKNSFYFYWCLFMLIFDRYFEINTIGKSSLNKIWMGKITDIKFMDIGLYVNLYHFIINVDEWKCVLKYNASEQMFTSLTDAKRNLKD